mmetsp:Transcript_33957/g.62331  ORF Transcript_33957/g.62331 Transcript_33957/m.62331 type:complete len:296 (-) Transcript_33957:209-1096(-)
MKMRGAPSKACCTRCMLPCCCFTLPPEFTRSLSRVAVDVKSITPPWSVSFSLLPGSPNLFACLPCASSGWAWMSSISFSFGSSETFLLALAFFVELTRVASFSVLPDRLTTALLALAFFTEPAGIGSAAVLFDLPLGVLPAVLSVDPTRTGSLTIFSNRWITGVEFFVSALELTGFAALPRVFEPSETAPVESCMSAFELTGFAAFAWVFEPSETAPFDLVFSESSRRSSSSTVALELTAVGRRVCKRHVPRSKSSDTLHGEVSGCSGKLARPAEITTNTFMESITKSRHCKRRT